MQSVEKGDRVILKSAKSKPSLEIPLWGSLYGCVGTALHNSKDIAIIRWDNGEQTKFYIYKLKLYDKPDRPRDPNIAFLHKKRGM